MVDNATHALASSATAKPTFNVEEEDVVIRNGWTPKEEECVIIMIVRGNNAGVCGNNAGGVVMLLGCVAILLGCGNIVGGVNIDGVR